MIYYHMINIRRMIPANNSYSWSNSEISKFLKRHSEELLYKRKQVIYVEGSSVLGFFTVNEGSVKITKYGEDGREQILRIVSEGNSLNALDVCSQSKCSCSAIALEDAKISFISKYEFWESLEKEHGFLPNFLQQVFSEANELQNKIMKLVMKPIRGRLAESLINLGDLHENEIHISRTDLAAYTGTVRETITRLLSELKREGIIDTSRKTIKIKNRKGLKKITEIYE